MVMVCNPQKSSREKMAKKEKAAEENGATKNMSRQSRS
jgi:hypothetical protein